MSHVEITTSGGTAKILLDGHDVSSSVVGYWLDHARPGDIARLTLDVLATKHAEIEGEVYVQIWPPTAALLIRLGWTPPTAERARLIRDDETAPVDVPAAGNGAPELTFPAPADTGPGPTGPGPWPQPALPAPEPVRARDQPPPAGG